MKAIKVFVVFPKRKDRWKYYINDNLKDQHILHRDKLQEFILQYTNAEAGNQVIYHLNKYQAFIVYTKENKVYRIQADKQKALEKMRKDFNNKNFNSDAILKKIKKEEKKDTLFSKENDNMLKKFLK